MRALIQRVLEAKVVVEGQTTGEIQPESNGTLVTLTHKGLENFDHLGADFKKEKFQNGWDEILNKALKNFVEN
jgi:D-Tyr-tRNAtyr deacylase